MSNLPRPDDSLESRPYAILRSSLTFVLSTAFLGIGLWASYWAELRNDQYQLLSVGKCVRDGGRLYVDCWENEPPGVFWLNAAGIALSEDGQFVAWLLPGAAALLSLMGFWLALRRVATIQAARRSVVLASLVMSARSFDSPSINPDFYCFSFELIAISLWMLSLHGRTRSGAIAAGLLAGFAWAAATTIKQVGCLGLMALSMVALALLIVRHPGRRQWLGAAGLALLGFAAGVAAAAFALTRSTPPEDAWFAIVEFNRRFVPREFLNTVAYSWPRVRAELGLLQLWLWLGALGAIGAAVARSSTFTRPWAAAMLLWLLVAGWFASVGPSMSLRYWQGIWAPLLWLAGAGLEWMNIAYRRADRIGRVTLGVVFITVLLVLFRPFAFDWRSSLGRAYLAYLEEPNERGRLTEIGNEIASLVPPGERIYIWAYDIGPYLFADRKPASRHTHPRSPEQMGQILGDLAAGRAYAILVPKGPPSKFQEWCEAECQDRLQAILREYSPSGRIGRYEVWVRGPKDRP